MQTLKLGQRVVAAANCLFHGEVIEVGDDATHGYVRFDGEADDARTFFSASELDDEPKPEPVGAAAPIKPETTPEPARAAWPLKPETTPETKPAPKKK